MIVDFKYIYKNFKYTKGGRNRIPFNICSIILCDVLKAMINDIIEHNTYIEIPKSWGTAMLYMKEIKGEEFKNRYREGEFQDIDYLASDYTSYKIAVKSNTFDEGFEIDVNDEMNDIIINKTNKGYRY